MYIRQTTTPNAQTIVPDYIKFTYYDGSYTLIR